MFNLKIKTTIVLSISMLCLLLVTNYSQYQIRSYDLFCNNANMPGEDHGRSIINRIDKGYAISGYSYASACGIGPQDWMFIKLKASGLIDTVRLIGFTSDDRCYSLIQSPADSGYVLAGYMSTGVYRKATLVKLNKSSGLEYSKRISSSYNSQYNQVILNPYDRWTFAGYGEQYINADKIPQKILVTNYSSGGVRIWGYKYLTFNTDNSINAFNDAANSVCFQNTDSTYCVAARTSYYSSNNTNYDIMVMKISSSGAVRWNRIYRFNLIPAPNYYTSAVPRKIIAMPDGGFVIVGSTNVNKQDETDIIVMRISSTGGIMWSRVYGDLSYDECGESVVLDGDLFVAGARRKVTLPFDVIVMKIPVGGGAPVWVRRWDPNNPTDYGYDIIKSNTGGTGGFAVTGETQRGGMPDPFLMRINTFGIVEGQNCIQAVTLSSGIKPQKTDSVNITKISVSDVSWTPNIVTPPSNVNDICVAADNLLANEENSQPVKFALEQNYPNPFNPNTLIEFSVSKTGKVKLEVFDITGRKVATLADEIKSAGSYRYDFDASNLAAGVYLYKLRTESESITKKMVLVK